MEVKLWICVVLINLVLSNGQDSKLNILTPDDKSNTETKQNDNKPEELHTKDFIDGKDYLLPPVFPQIDHEDEEDEDENSYDYDYGNKDINYKDSPNSGTPKPVGHDDKIPLHTSKDNLPVFLLEPENTYVVKNKPAILKCRAANALEVYFKCNGVKTQPQHFEFVDPQSGVRIVEGDYQVTREQVEEYFGTEKYQCSCFAWTSRGHIRSQPATIELAYIKKHFTVAPQSQLVKQGSPVTFHCEPPPAAPFAQMYWLKNGAPVVADDNVQINKEADLVIKQASLLDMANYSCVAENLAGKRISEPALLTVFVNGGWTSWSAWTECCRSQETRDTRGKRRERTCTAPRPLNGGQPCVGPSVQKTPDCVDCDLDLYVDGIDELADESPDVIGIRTRWSQWSEWSRCNSDCLQSRRRRCLSSIPSDCLGLDYQVAQCPLCVRTSKSLIHDGSSYLPIFIALSVAFLIFIVVAVLGIKYMKIKMEESSPYAKPPPGSNYFGSVIKRTLTNQPDLTIHEEFQTMDSRRTRYLSTSTNPRQEHLYEVPQLANSMSCSPPISKRKHLENTERPMKVTQNLNKVTTLNTKILDSRHEDARNSRKSHYMSPIDHEVRAPSTRACKDLGSDRSDSSCFLSSGSSYNESVEMSPSLRNNASLNSKVTNHYLENTTSKIVGVDGDWLMLDKCGARLFVPEGVVEKGDELFSLEVSDEELNGPTLLDGETQLSPVIRCSPKNFHFNKAVILSFPHCASLKNSSWVLSILQKPEEINNKEWRKVLILGQETPGAPIFAQVDPSKVYLVSEFLSDFVLVGRSFSGLDSKLLKLALFISKRFDDGYYNLKCHVFNDTPYDSYETSENERRSGYSLLCEQKTILFQENCSDLCFNVRGVGEGWKIKPGEEYQELSYSKIWNIKKSLHCTFVLQQIDSINCLDLNLTVYQKQKHCNSAKFNLKTNDLNSNYNCKRFSSISIDTGPGYTVNILENPFNYSSLSRKEGRYDFVYKNCSTRSNFSVDNNYRINVLTKSDRVILCKLLDGQTSKGNDWRMLAEKLRVANYFYYLSNTCSPTENLLNLWMCRHNNSNMLVNLARTFRDMSRFDCATVVERRCFPN